MCNMSVSMRELESAGVFLGVVGRSTCSVLLSLHSSSSTKKPWDLLKLIEPHRGPALLAKYHLLITLTVLSSRLIHHGRPAEPTMKL